MQLNGFQAHAAPRTNVPEVPGWEQQGILTAGNGGALRDKRLVGRRNAASFGVGAGEFGLPDDAALGPLGGRGGMGGEAGGMDSDDHPIAQQQTDT